MTNLHYPAIAFIGAGNMAHCLISGLLANAYPVQQIYASNPRLGKPTLIEHEYGISVFENNLDAAQNAQILVLAVKPQIIKSVLTELQLVIKKNKPLIISIAAGTPVRKLEQWTSAETAIVRCMPNIASFVRSGATGMFANACITPLQRDLAENIMRTVGLTLWVDNENLIEIIAALSGSGPAYFFLVMEALEAAAIKLGLSASDARLLTSQTALGAARLALSSEERPQDLRARVTSKGGTTEKAIAVLEKFQLHDAFYEALQAAYQRSIELSLLE